MEVDCCSNENAVKLEEVAKARVGRLEREKGLNCRLVDPWGGVVGIKSLVGTGSNAAGAVFVGD